MSQPTKKTGAGGYSQLSGWIPTDVKNQIARLASAAGIRQIDMLERLLRAGAAQVEKEIAEKEESAA